MPEKDLSISEFIWHVFEDKCFTELFEIFFTFSFNVFGKAENVLFDFEELFEELFEWSAVNVS
jgi:hypothetical protein